MRGDYGEVSLEVERSRAAFELRKPDAGRRTAEALARARRPGDIAEAQDLADVLCDFRNRRLYDDLGGPTAEALVHFRNRRQRGDTVAALFGNGSLDFGEQAAAYAISTIFETLTTQLWTRSARLERGRVGGGSSSGGGIPERIAALYHGKYRPWATWMSDPRSLFIACSKCARRYSRALDACDCGCKRFWRARPHLGLVLSVVVFGSGLERSAVAYRMGRRRALRLLQFGLSRYADFV
jgi:hypothetical protein